MSVSIFSVNVLEKSKVWPKSSADRLSDRRYDLSYTLYGEFCSYTDKMSLPVASHFLLYRFFSLRNKSLRRWRSSGHNVGSKYQISFCFVACVIHQVANQIFCNNSISLWKIGNCVPETLHVRRCTIGSSLFFAMCSYACFVVYIQIFLSK